MSERRSWKSTRGENITPPAEPERSTPGVIYALLQLTLILSRSIFPMSGLSATPAGLVGGIKEFSAVVKTIVAVFLSITLYNAVELTILILLNFHFYHGLYFWTMLVSNLVGIIPTTIGAVLHFFSIGPLSLALILSNIGFYAMVPGQSLVLYSRLHLLFYHPRRLRYILYTIIVTAISLVIPVTTTVFGSAYARTHQWNKAYQIVERVQVTGFCTLEFLISSLYVYQTIKLLQLRPKQGWRRIKLMYELLAINFTIVLMDAALLVVEYLGFYYMQVFLKSLVYSIKLKLEFAVLGRLVSLVDRHHHGQVYGDASDASEAPEFIHPLYMASEFSHTTQPDVLFSWSQRSGRG